MSEEPKIELYHGDCLKILPTLPDNSINLIFVDPPYGCHVNDNDLISHREGRLLEGVRKSRKGEVRWFSSESERDSKENLTKGKPIVIDKGKDRAAKQTRPIANDKTREEADNLFRACLPEFKRLLKPDAGVCVCCSGGGGSNPMFARWSLWLDEQFHFMQCIVWDKGMGMGNKFRRSTEYLLIATKSKKSAWYDTTKKVENIIRPSDYGIRKILPRSHNHPTEKPPELSRHFIKLFTKEGDTVMDCFMGRCGTGVSAKAMNRNFIGMELDLRWYEASKRRIANMFRGITGEYIEPPT